MKWERVVLGDYIDILSGFPFESKLFSESEGTPLIRIRDVVRGYTNTFYNGNFENSYLVKRGDILVGMDGEFNTAKWSSEPALLNQRVCKITSKDSTSLSEKYLFHLLPKKLKEIEDRTSFVTVKHLSVKNINAIEIDLPPLPIQQQIADTLDKADALRRKDLKLLDKYDELAQAVFYEMFGDVVSSTSKYPVSKFGSEVKIKGGKRLPLGHKLVKQNTGLPYIKAGDIKSGRILTNNLEYLLPETQKKIKNYIVKQGDVCVTIVGANIGDVGVVPKDLDGANLTENAAKLIIMNNERLDNIYLSNYWSMPFVQSQIKLKSMAVGVPKLALFRIEEMDLVLPPLIMQKKFNSIKEIIDKEKNMLIESVQHSNNLFKSLSSKHFE